MTFNHLVPGSNPGEPTIFSADHPFASCAAVAPAVGQVSGYAVRLSGSLILIGF